MKMQMTKAKMATMPTNLSYLLLFFSLAQNHQLKKERSERGEGLIRRGLVKEKGNESTRKKINGECVMAIE